MESLASLVEDLGPLLQTVVVAVVAIVILAAARWLLEKRISQQTEGAFRIQIIRCAFRLPASRKRRILERANSGALTWPGKHVEEALP